ncbi:MAG: DUF1513 domain-containing protein [Hyphomicrobiaceae bacterium]|nr:DUF1513 domain-containing protein [Hyphomicrobiaceae bacterium]
MIDRRNFLGASSGLAASLLLPGHALAIGTEPSMLYASACKDAQGRFAALLFDADTGREVAGVVLPARGHDIAPRPGSEGRLGRELVAFARRPGNFAVVFGDTSGASPLWFTSRPDRYFYGHGVFSADGRLLFTSENDFEAGVGRIGVRDASGGYKQIGELPAGGIGSHDLALLSDRRTLVVANGGIKTHPATPRLELNLSSMEPSLTYIDSETGDVMEKHTVPPELHQLSIRHLAVGKGDTVIFGCQYRGPGWQTQQIVGRHRRGRPIELLTLPDKVGLAMRNYVASLTADPAGDTVVVAAPRGGLAVVLEVATGRLLGSYTMDSVFGVAPRAGGGFVLTSGNGQLATARPIAAGTPIEPRLQALAKAWDNHLVAVR